MFNPQRKNKMVDIYMQEKSYRIHLQKKKKIERSKSKVKEQQDEQYQYLLRLQKSKREIKNRLSENLRTQNRRLMNKLIDTEQKSHFIPDEKKPVLKNKEHFNSYFSLKKEKQRIYNENYTMVMRMDKTGPGIPSLQDLKKQYKQNKRYAKNCRKLPTIFKYQQQFKKVLSSAPFHESGVNSRTTRVEKNTDQDLKN